MICLTHSLPLTPECAMSKAADKVTVFQPGSEGNGTAEVLLLLFIGYFMSQQHASVSQGPICFNKCLCYQTGRSCRSNFLPHPVTDY